MTPEPGGRRAAAASGSGSRLGSVTSHRLGRAFPWRRPRPRVRAVLVSLFTAMSPSDTDTTALAPVLARIAAAAKAAGRDPGSITLTAVSKMQPWERVAPILAAGQRVFGENRVQEALERWDGRREGLEL